MLFDNRTELEKLTFRALALHLSLFINLHVFKRRKNKEQTLFSCYFQLTEKARVQVFGFPG